MCDKSGSKKKGKSIPNFCMLTLSESATYTLSEESKANPSGALDCPPPLIFLSYILEIAIANCSLAFDLHIHINVHKFH